MAQLYTYKATCTKVIDGDTVELLLDLGFHVSLVIRGRLYNVFAPELFSGTDRVRGQQAKDYLESIMSNGATFIVSTYKDKTTFGRWVVNIATVDGVSINELAAAYNTTH